MKQKLKFILSSFTLLLFALLACGSYDDSDVGDFLLIFGVAILGLIIALTISNFIKEGNKKQRLQIIKREEAKADDFDYSVSFGDDRCMFYSDEAKRKVMIMKVMTESVKKYIVDDFVFSDKKLCCQNEPYFCIYDEKNRHLLCGSYKDEVVFENKNIANEDKNNDIIVKNSIPAKLISHRVNGVSTRDGDYKYTTLKGKYIYTLIDECHALIAIVRNGKISSIFNYINGSDLQKKTMEKSYINNSCIGHYNFIMDDFFNVFVIITPISYKIFKYSDIIEVSYEENGTQLYSKSATRTIGGALVGGALMGGAGAVVGGLSGASKKNMEIKTMDIKILLRSTQESTYILSFNNANRVLKTKDSSDESLYKRFYSNANKAKDLLSVIIDKSKQKSIETISQEKSHSVQQLSISDELIKLAKLKSEGLLTEEEFNAQKAKLLNL